MYKTIFQSFQSTKLEPEVRTHLSHVYGTLTLGAIVAATGGYVHTLDSFIHSGLFTQTATILSLFVLYGSSDGRNHKNHQLRRLFLFLIFSFFMGCNLGPLLNKALSVNPAVVVQALLGTSIVFVCFSLSALFAPTGHYLYLGGILYSVLSILFWLSVSNILFGSVLIFKVSVYVGLFMFCGFIIYDTQMIIDDVKIGNKDYVIHAVNLLVDFVAIFKRLLIILIEKEQGGGKKEKEKKKRK